jgi:small-conductance mechanosensitive channel
MNPLPIFLIIVIVTLGAGGYYQYNVMEKVEEDQAAKISANLQQIHNLGAEIDKLTSEKKALEDTKIQQAKRLDDANAIISDLNKHLQAVQSDLADTQQQLAAEKAKPPPPQTDELGTITTPNGKSYFNCVLLRVDPDGIVVSHTNGIVKILYGWLSSDFQVRFGYNLLPDAAKVEAEVKAQEEQQNKTGQGAGN